MYTAGPGITIAGNQISNTGDPSAADDITTSSTAGGALSGPFANLQINTGAVTGSNIAQQGAATGQVLKWNGTTWAPQNDNGEVYTAGPGITIAGNQISNTGDPSAADDITTSSTAGGALSGPFANLQINTGAVTGSNIAQQGAATGQVLKWNGTTWAPDNDGFNGFMSGDVNGLIGSNEVLALRGRPIGGMPPTGDNVGYAYVYDGNSWQLDTLQGDISGRFTSATVKALRGRPIGGMPPTGDNVGYAYVYDGNSWQLDTLQGDISGRFTSATVKALRGRPIGGMPPTGDNVGYAYVYDGNSWQLDTLKGDISGRLTNASVKALRGRPIGGMPPTGANSALIHIPNGANDGSFEYSDPNGDITVDAARKLTVSRIQDFPVDFSDGVGDGMVLTCVDDGGGLKFKCRTPSALAIPYANSFNLNSPLFSLTNNFTTNNEAVTGLQVSHRGPFAIKGSTNQDYRLFGFGNQGFASSQLGNKDFYYPAGVYGENTSTHPDSAGAGVLGRAVAGNNNNRGVGGWFQGNSVGSMSMCYPGGFSAVAGYATQTEFAGFFKLYDPNGTGQAALYAESTNSNTWAGYFYGEVGVQNNLQVGNNMFCAGSITGSNLHSRIDHPLDPENKFLVHSSVESPDMKNIYDGVVRTDQKGFATVQLPTYFEALNQDFRYQLTVLEEFAQAIIYKKVAGNQFVIRTDKPGIEVSWQLTGIRKDPYAEAHRTVVEPEKAPQEKGYFVNPELYGKPETMRISGKKIKL
ncbi:MAG: hypothetical protein R3D58_12010 [Saprospiraceae bacterium]